MCTSKLCMCSSCGVTLSVYVTYAHALLWGGRVTIPDASIVSCAANLTPEADFAKGLSRMDNQRDNPEQPCNAPLITNNCGRWAKLYGTWHHERPQMLQQLPKPYQNGQAFAAHAYQVSLACCWLFPTEIRLPAVKCSLLYLFCLTSCTCYLHVSLWP